MIIEILLRTVVMLLDKAGNIAKTTAAGSFGWKQKLMENVSRIELRLTRLQ